MTIIVSISPQVEARLRERAEAAGKNADEYAAELIEQGLGTDGVALAGMAAGRQIALIEELFAETQSEVGRYPQGYVADDSRASVYDGDDE